jgi:uncharacterized protein (TIGR03084 family)
MMAARTVTLAELLADLAAETRVVDDMQDTLTPAQWELPTPAAGWAIRDQVSHLAFFDDAAVPAATDPDRFRAEAAELVGPTFPDEVADHYRRLPVDRLAGWYHAARDELLNVFGGLGGRTRVLWYGPDMSVTSSATARLMETWAHGQDIADTLGATREPTDRLRHIAHLGVLTFGFSYQRNSRPVPSAGVRVDLVAPDGGGWTWGEDICGDSVTGSALDFCLVVTQRRNLADTDLTVSGPVATEWMSIAQAFAGAPGTGRKPGEFPERRSA